MTREEFVANKRKALIQNRIELAQSIVETAIEAMKSFPPRKSAFRSRNRFPKNKWKGKVASALFQGAFRARMIDIQWHIIASQPIPKYPLAGFIASLNNSEFVISSNGKKYEIKD
jgi:hypothetical protein